MLVKYLFQITDVILDLSVGWQRTKKTQATED